MRRGNSIVKHCGRIQEEKSGRIYPILKYPGSTAAELETQIIISEELYENINFSVPENLLLEIQKVLSVTIKKLAAKR